jgi:Ca-activated chloride channel homolog
VTTRAAIVIACAAIVTAAAQPSIRVEIVSPADGEYVSDRITLEAQIMPPELRGEVVDVAFFADGRLVCRTANIDKPACAWDAGPTVKAHAIRAVATTRSGQRIIATARTRDLDVNASVDVRVVQVNVSVSDRRGNFVSGLRRDLFHVKEDGVPQQIIHFADEKAPLEIVVAMDISGSMGAAIDDLKIAVREFLAKLRPNDMVTVVAFNEEMFVLADRASDQAARVAAVDRLSSFGGTTLYDAIIRSVELLSKGTGRRSLVLFSDGEDQSSQSSFAVVDRALKGSDATLFTVALGRGREQASLRETLEALAEPTGGRVIVAENSSELGAAFGALLDELTHQYLVGYESTNPKRDGAWRKLDVDIPGTNHRVRARQGYFAPTPQ